MHEITYFSLSWVDKVYLVLFSSFSVNNISDEAYYPMVQAPHLASDTIHQTTDANAKVSLDNGPYPGISYIYNSFDLFSQLYDDNSWQRQGFDPTTDSARKTIGSPVQSNVRSKRKTVDEKSRFSADKINAAKSSSRDNAEQHAIKHGSKREVVPSLHVVAEETDNDSKTLSTSNGGGMSDNPDRSSSSVHEPEVIKQHSYRFLVL
jgi:translation initiation factor 2-alpha kinase 4